MKLLKRTWADVSLDHLAHNYTILRGQVPASCRFLGVVKADAYGHGAVPVSHHWRSWGRSFWRFPIWRRLCSSAGAVCSCPL